MDDGNHKEEFETHCSFQEIQKMLKSCGLFGWLAYWLAVLLTGRVAGWLACWPIRFVQQLTKNKFVPQLTNNKIRATNRQSQSCHK